MSQIGGNENAPAGAIDPKNGRHRVVAYNTGSPFPGPDLTVARSEDAGATWTRDTPLAGSCSGVGDECFNPALRFDSETGILLETNARFHPGVFPTVSIDAHRSLDGGKSFTRLDTLATGFVNDPALDIGQGMVWVAWDDFAGGGVSARGAAITPSGSVGPFGPTFPLPGSAFGESASVAIDALGRVAVSYLTQTATGSRISINVKADGLGPAGFGSPLDVVDTFIFPDLKHANDPRTVALFVNFRLTHGDAENPARVGPQLNGVPAFGIVYEDAPSSGSTDTNIFFRRSTDGGATWSAPVRINDDTGTNSQFSPALAFDRATGTLVAVWYDARNDPGNVKVELFGAGSADGGLTWSRNFRISPGASDATLVNTFNGLGVPSVACSNGVCQMFWADNSAELPGNPDRPRLDIASARIVVRRPTVITGAGAGGGSHVRAFDTRTDAEQFGFLAFDPGFPGGARVAVGDVTGDGVPDLVVGPGPGGGPNVRIFDGVTGQPIPGPRGSFMAFDRAFSGGVFVAVGQCDGTPRVIVGADAGGGPHVKVFDATTGALLFSSFVYPPGFTGGVRVAAGDVNGDGCDDIVTGAGPGGGPHVQVFSGRDLSLLYSFLAYDPSFAGGVYVAAGDVDGDGKADIITGAGAGGGPHVKVFSGADGSVLQSFLAFDPGFPGGVRVAAVDARGNGKALIIVSAGPGGGPEVKVLDGTTLAVLRDALVYDAGFRGGVYVGGR